MCVEIFDSISHRNSVNFGIVSSVMLILNYIVNLVGFATFSDSDWFHVYIKIDSAIIYPSVFLGFYYSLYRSFLKCKIRGLIEPIKIIYMIELFVISTNVVQFLGINIPNIFIPILNFIIFTVFIVWTVKLLKYRGLVEQQMIKAKRFALVSLICHIIIFLATISDYVMIMLSYHPNEIVTYLISIYAISYYFGFDYFLEQKKTVKV